MSRPLSKDLSKDVKVHAGDMGDLNTVTSHGIGEVRVQQAAMHSEFNLWSTLGIGFSYIATPLSIGTFLVYSLAAGGSAYFFWGYVVCFVFQTLVVLSLAEMAGFAPHTSGR
jgi:choline transport protein